MRWIFPGRSVGQLPDLIEHHNQTVRDLETVLVRYLKGGRIGKTRPTITVGGFLGIGGEKKVNPSCSSVLDSANHLD